MDIRVQFSASLKAIYALYGKELSDNVVALWASAINAAGLTLEQAIQGLNKHTVDPDNGRWLPTPAHIIEQIKGGKADLEAEALIEYRNACQGAAKAGQYNDAVFANHKTNMAIELMGGWVYLCNYEELSEYIGQKRFVDAYKAVSANPIQCSLPLCGTADSRNLYKFGRTPEEKAQCDKLLELHGSDRVTAVNALESIKIKQLESGV